MALPSVDCFKGLDLRDQITAIYEALYDASPDPGSLTSPACFKGEDWRDQITDIYAALLGSDSPGLLLAASYDTDFESFSRIIAAGYTGLGDADPYQREKAPDEMRDAHDVGGVLTVLLQDDPTQCNLVAPANLEVTPNNLDFTATFDALDGDVLRYEWRLDETGSWIDNGLSTTINGSTFIGTHTMDVRGVSPSGIEGATAISDPFDATSDGIQFSDDFAGSGPLSANWTVEAGTIARVADALQTSTASSFSKQVAIYTGTDTAIVDQYCKIKLDVPSDGTAFPMMFLRFTDAASPHYAFVFSPDVGDIGWYQTPSVASGTFNLIGSGSGTFNGSSSIGATIDGTGASTVARFWINPVSGSPLSMSVWDGNPPDLEIAVDPAGNAVDTGNEIGVGGTHHTSVHIRIDSFIGGNL